jgi:hypothetical protein
MDYTKPQMRLLGNACALIEACGTEKALCEGDGTGDNDRTINSAYDLDE